MTDWLSDGAAHLLILLLGGLDILGLGGLELVPAVLVHQLEDLQLILAHLGEHIVEHVAQAALAAFHHFGGNIGHQRFFLTEQVKGQLLIGQRRVHALDGGVLLRWVS